MRGFGVWIAGGLIACAPAPRITTARLTLEQLPSCTLGSGQHLSLRATGDFPSKSELLDKAAEVALDGLPLSTQWLALEAQQGKAQALAGGLVALPSGRDLDRSVLMLPLGRSCPLGDPLARAPTGAAVAGLVDGSLLIAGGQDESGAATRNAVLLPAGDALVQQVTGGMLLRRADATATRVDAGVLVVGGGEDAQGRAHDTFEVYDADLGRFDVARSRSLVSGPRRAHGAVRLPDGRVLVAGGQAEVSGKPLATAELIDPIAGKAEAVESTLNFARVAPSLLVLDSGIVLVALGADGVSADAAPVPNLERFDPHSSRFSTLDATLPTHAQAAVAVLECDRVVYLGCDAGDAGCELAVLLPQGDDFEVITLAADLGPDALAAAGLQDLEQIRLLPLHDGTLLVTGRKRGPPIARQAFLVDLSSPAVTAVPDAVSRVPDVLLALEDGTLAELDALGVSLGRHDLTTELDNPATPLVDAQTLHVALDEPSRWERVDGALVAKKAARFDLSFLRFADLRLDLTLAGTGFLLLEPDGQAPVEIAISAGSVALGKTCTLTRQSGKPVEIERHDTAIELRSGGHAVSCTASTLRGRIGVALSADATTAVRSLLVTRL